MKALATILVLMSVGMAMAQDKVVMRSIVVTGTADVKVAADHAVVRLGVVSRGDTAASAQVQANNVMTTLLAAMAALKIEKEDIQTSNLTLQPVYDNQPREVPQIVGYEARNTVSVIVRDLGQIGKVIDAGIGAGANNVEGVFFGLLDDSKAKLAALGDAVASALAKAKVIAAASGILLGDVIEIIEGGASIVPPPMMEGRMMMDKGAGTPVEPGQVSVSASVTIRYAIRP